MEQLAARRAHNPEVIGSSPIPATNKKSRSGSGFFVAPTPPNLTSGRGGREVFLFFYLLDGLGGVESRSDRARAS